MTDSTFITLDPTSGPLDRTDPRKLPQRPKTLDGAVVGLVANGLGVSQQFMDVLLEEINKESELAGAVRVLKGSVAVPPEPGDWELLTSEATVAIAGISG